jgi:hypothetical protein
LAGELNGGGDHRVVPENVEEGQHELAAHAIRSTSASTSIEKIDIEAMDTKDDKRVDKKEESRIDKPRDDKR